MSRHECGWRHFGEWPHWEVDVIGLDGGGADDLVAYALRKGIATVARAVPPYEYVAMNVDAESGFALETALIAWKSGKSTQPVEDASQLHTLAGMIADDRVYYLESIEQNRRAQTQRVIGPHRRAMLGPYWSVDFCSLDEDGASAIRDYAYESGIGDYKGAPVDPEDWLPLYLDPTLDAALTGAAESLTSGASELASHDVRRLDCLTDTVTRWASWARTR